MISIKLEEEIEKSLDKIIEEGQKLVDSTPEVLEKRFGEAQIRNLIEIASSVDSVKALEVFIKYQMGRRTLPVEFGEKLVKEIEGIGNIAKQIAKGDPEQQKKVWLRLNRLFLGYLQRYFVYKKKVEGAGEEEA